MVRTENVRRLVGGTEGRDRQRCAARPRRPGCAQELLEMLLGQARQADLRGHFPDFVERQGVIRHSVLPYSPLMPAALMTPSHLFCSDTISLPNSAELIFTTAPPCSSNRF